MPDQTLDQVAAAPGGTLAADQVAAADLVYLLQAAGAGADKAVRADALLDALLRVAAAGGVISLDATAGELVVRKRGGTAGTHEVRVSHDGTRGTVESKTGGMRLVAPGGLVTNIGIGLGGSDMYGSGWVKDTGTWEIRLWLAGQPRAAFADDGIWLRSDIGYGWNSGAPPSQLFARDLSLRRAAAKVLGVTDGLTGGATLRSVPLTPAQVTADQHNYAPGVARYYRLSTDAARTVTGLSVSQVDGQECEAWNVGAFALTLAHQSAASSAGNRFVCPGAADLTLAADDVALLRYDATSSRWRARKV